MKKILVLDFGSQYTQLIARRVRELEVYCEIAPFHHMPDSFDDIAGVILSGSPFSVFDEDAPSIDINFISKKAPVLGLCYGAQYIANTMGGSVHKSNKREYGKSTLNCDVSNVLFSQLTEKSTVWMSHGDTIDSVGENFNVIGSTHNIPIAAFQIETQNHPIFGLQFHPEVYHSDEGSKMLSNFLFQVCGCKHNWTPTNYIESTVLHIKDTVGSEQVLMALSGGVDSTVAAELIHRAIGDQLHCFFIDNGLLRLNEFEEVLDSYQHMGLNIVGLNETDNFLDDLEGVFEPEKKRKIIGGKFIEVFDKAAATFPNVKWLGQGTIYPDVIESISVHGPSVTIKSHHNVGGLPDHMNLKVLEPLRSLFKDEVRKVGRALDITPNILNRHPFPGPGLAIRIIGEITRDKINMLQRADAIFIEQLKKHNWYNKVWQAGVMFLPIQSVGVMGDERTYENVVSLRAVSSTDGMTADWSQLPYELLADTSNEIINNVKGINRVVYDISSKPPATIEWE